MRTPCPKFLGFTLVELVVTLALFLLLAGVAAPNVMRWMSNLRLDAAAYELSGILRSARSRAIRDGFKVGVKFYPPDGDGRVRFGLYRDGNGNGVRTRDIESGVDPSLRPSTHILNLGADVRFGFPEGKAPRDPGDPRRRLGRLQDPIRFNRSDLASFGPLGGSTPGSLYVTDGKNLVVVRVFGRTGKIKILRYDRRRELWRY